MKNKEEVLKREEKAKQPKLTFEMIKQIKHAYSVAKEDRPKLETLENRFEIKMHELLAKIGNKTDLEEFESQIEQIREELKKTGNKLALEKDSKRRYSTIKISSPVLQGESGQNDAVLRKYIERWVDEIDKKMEKTSTRIDNLEDAYGKHSNIIREIQRNSEGGTNDAVRLLELQLNDINSRVTSLSSSKPKYEPTSPIINYTISTKDSKNSASKQPSRIIINNNADKLETEK
jgi:hypothetical protein